MTIEDLAGMVKRGFDETARKDETATKEDVRQIREEMATKEDLNSFKKETRENFQSVYARLDLIREDISDLPAIREELQDLRVRVERLEHRAKATK